jgi:hypothetical protein
MSITRSRRFWLLALVLAVAAAVLVAPTAPTANAARKAAGKVEARPYQLPLTRTTQITPAVSQALADAQQAGQLGATTPLRAVLADRTVTRNSTQPWYSGGTLAWKSRCGAPVKVLAALDKKKKLGGWCWPAADQERGALTASRWVPQGVTSTSEASGSGLVDGARATAASWYGNTGDARSIGSRVSFFSTPVTGRDAYFNHVVLATASVDRLGQLDLLPVRAHAGGLAWNGPYLFVPQTNHGIRVFDTRQIYRVENGSTLGATAPDGVINGGGARYAMLEVARYYQADTAGCQRRSFFPICFSSVGIDRSTSPARLVVTEHIPWQNLRRLDRGATIASWDLGPDLMPRVHASGVALSRPIRANHTPNTQGLVMKASTKQYFFSAGTPHNGWFYYEKSGDGKPPRRTSEWPQGAEDITRQSDKRRLWSITELPGKRTVFWVDECQMRVKKNKSCR